MKSILFAFASIVSVVVSAGADEIPVCYVNASNYDPTSSDYGNPSRCDGTTLAKGFGTLAKAMRWAYDNSTGSRVLVGPGVYDKSTFGTVKSRCPVQPNTIVESLEGPEKTIIVGAGSADESADDKGNGSDAVRCVRMSAGGVLRGFTLTGGHTENSTDSNLGYGGAVWAKNLTDVRIENCIITNNTSAQSVCYFGTYVNCLIKDNKPSNRYILESTTLDSCRITDNEAPAGVASVYSSRCCVIANNSVGVHACRDGEWINCVITNNVSTGGSAIYGASMVNCLVTGNTGSRSAERASLALNCTFGPWTPIASTTYLPACGFWDQRGPAVNTIFITRPDGYTSGNVLYMTNCFYISGAAHTQVAVNCKQFTSAAAMGLDADYRPIKGGEAVGFGTNELYSAAAPDVKFTLDGVPRILNGNVDVGAYEYNWCEDFAAALGPDVVVTNAAPEVMLNEDGQVLVPNGKSIAGYMKEKPGYSICRMTADPSATGTLYPENRSPVAVSGSEIQCRSKGRMGFDLAGVGSTVLSDFVREQGGLMLLFR